MEKLKSRKFWLAIVGAILPILNETFGWSIPTEAILTILGPILAYIFAEAYVDAKAAFSPTFEITTTPSDKTEKGEAERFISNAA